MIHHSRLRRGFVVAIAASLALAASLSLASCAGGSQSGAPSSPESSESLAALTMHDAWVKSTEDGASMTGVFGTIANSTAEDINIVGASTDAAHLVELHEVTDGVMRERSGGFVVPAGGELELVPGGFHIMLMEMPDPILAGEDVVITLELSDGETFEFTAMVKDYSGANEDYGDLQHDHGHGHEHGHEHDGH